MIFGASGMFLHTFKDFQEYRSCDPAAVRTSHQSHVSRWYTQHQWAMKSCSWKDENWWYSTTNRIDDHTCDNHSSSYTDLFCPNLSNNVRRLYNSRFSCFVNVTHSVISKFPRFKCTLTIVEEFHYICFT